MGAEVRKTVTVVFCDVAGSTELGERLDPEAVRGVMTRYFDEMRAVLERHGGTVEKFIGDAVVAVFGIPTLHEDDALRAVRAAEEMRERIAGLSEELQREWGAGIVVRIGVSTGEVVAGAADSGQTVATGDAVNVAARLQGAAEPSEILLGAETFRLVRDAVTAEPAGPLQLKGKSEPVRAHRLIAITPGAPGFARRLDEVLVGRTEELALLRDWFDAAVRDQRVVLVTVLGPAGIGKSRLALELGAAVSGEARILRGRCLDYGEGMSFWPLEEAVRELDLEQTLAGEPDEELVALRIQSALGHGEAAGAIEETYWAVRRLFEAVARKRPLVLVFEDIHWAETALLDLLEYLAEWTRAAPILIVCLARPDLLDQRPGWSGMRLELGALSAEEGGMLVDNLLAGEELAPEARSRVLEAAEGNPLFLEQMAAMLAENGTSAGELIVPATIQALLGARLDQLEPEERTVIERASVIGTVFYWGAVSHLCPDSMRSRAGSHLLALARKDLIGPEPSDLAAEDAFRFRHVLIREAAYQALPKRARAELHEGFADWLEARAPQEDEILGYHLEQAHRQRAEIAPLDDTGRGLGRRAAERLARAGRQAAARSDMTAAASLWQRAVALLPRADPARLELLPDLGAALHDVGELPLASQVLEEAVESARAGGDSRVEWRSVVELLAVRGTVDPSVTGKDTFEGAQSAVAALEELGDDAGLARAWQLVSFMEFVLGAAGPSEVSIERAIEHAERAGATHALRSGLIRLFAALFYGPCRVEDAIGRCQSVLERRTGDRYIEAGALRTVGALVGMQGRFDEGRAMVERAREIHKELGMPIIAANIGFFSGPLELWARDPVAAERTLRESFEILEERGEKGFFSTIAALLAEAVYRQGRYDEAEEIARVSEEAAASDDFASQMRWRLVRAKVLARRGAYREAEELAREAVAVGEPTDYLDMRGDSLEDLAEVLSVASRPGAAEAVRKAVELYEQKGNIVSAARARARLAHLSA